MTLRCFIGPFGLAIVKGSYLKQNTSEEIGNDQFITMKIFSLCLKHMVFTNLTYFKLTAIALR